MVMFMRRAGSEDSATECYNPSTPGGMHVAAIIIGVIGLLIAAIATIFGLAIWFEDEDKLIRAIIKADFGEGRFLLGLVIIILGNIYGILLIAFGKLFHYFRMMLHHTIEMRAQNEVVIEKLGIIAGRLAPAPQPKRPVSTPPRPPS